jgi:hypothetical protein
VLLVVIVVLLVSTVTVVLDRYGRAHRDDRAAEEMSRTVRAQMRLDDQRRSDDERAFAEEDFPARYRRVLAADRDTDTAYRQWTTVPGTRFSVVSEAVQRCFGAVDTYDVVAARYPGHLFGEAAPERVDLSDARTDCGRVFWGQL